MSWKGRLVLSCIFSRSWPLEDVARGHVTEKPEGKMAFSSHYSDSTRNSTLTHSLEKHVDGVSFQPLPKKASYLKKEQGMFPMAEGFVSPMTATIIKPFAAGSIWALREASPTNQLWKALRSSLQTESWYLKRLSNWWLSLLTRMELVAM